MNDPITVLLVDDHPRILLGTELIINEGPSMRVVARTTDPTEAIQLARQHQPRVALIDLHFQNTFHYSLCPDIKSVSPGTVVGIQSAFSSPETAHHAFKIGADGFIGKTESNLDLTDFITRLASGEAILDPQIEANINGLPKTTRRDTLLAALDKWRSEADRESARKRIQTLSPRELQVLRSLANIEARLSWNALSGPLGFKSEQQVYAYAAKIKTRLGVDSVKEAIALIKQSGLVQ